MKTQIKLEHYSTFNYLLTRSDSTTQYHLINSQKSWKEYVENQIKVWESFNEEAIRKSAYQASWDYDKIHLVIKLTRIRIQKLEEYFNYLDE